MLTSSSRVCILSSLGHQTTYLGAKILYDNNDYMAPIIYLLEYGFQAYLPNLEIHNSGKMYYNFNGIETFMRQGYHEYGATLFVIYMICLSLCFPGNGAVIHEVLRSMESKSTTHSTQTTLKHMCEFTRKRNISRC